MDNWRDIKGFEGVYQVSDTGKVCRLLPNGKRKHINPVQGSGMRRVMLHRGKSCHMVQIAVVELEAFVSPRPHGYKAMVKDGNYDNLQLGNLHWVVRRQERYVQQSRAKRSKPKYTVEELQRHSPLWRYYVGRRTCKQCARYGDCHWRKKSDTKDCAAEGCRGWVKRNNI